MLIINRNHGYTIVELLIALNISMILITISATLFYVYTTYTQRFLDVIENQQYTLQSLEHINLLLDKSERFKIMYDDEKLTILSDTKGKIVITESSIVRNEVIMVTGYEEISISVGQRDDRMHSTFFPKSYSSDQRRYEIESENVSFITISISIGGKKYSINHHPRNIANRRFKNIRG
jgi:type II secretory pathway pseudopilin PulG